MTVPGDMCLQEETLIFTRLAEKFEDTRLIVVSGADIPKKMYAPWAHPLRELKGRCVCCDLLQQLTCVARDPMSAESLVKLLEAFVPEEPIHLSLADLSTNWNDAAVSVLCDLISSHSLMSLVSAVAFITTVF